MREGQVKLSDHIGHWDSINQADGHKKYTWDGYNMDPNIRIVLM